MRALERARDHARREMSPVVHIHHVVLALADVEPSAGADLLRASGLSREPAETSPDADDAAEGPARLSPELALHLAWVHGLRTGRDVPVEAAFLLSCVSGPTSSTHLWLREHGVDLDGLALSAAEAAGLPASAGRGGTRWARSPITVSVEALDAATGELRAQSRRYKVNVGPDDVAMIIPEVPLG